MLIAFVHFEVYGDGQQDVRGLPHPFYPKTDIPVLEHCRVMRPLQRAFAPCPQNLLAVPVEVGQEVKEGDIILEVETDKAAVEIPSPFNGRVQEIFVKAGDVVNVGDVMMTFSNGEEVQVVDEEKPAEKPAPAPEAVAVAGQVSPARKDGPVPASPATRRLARELGVDLHSVTPTGPAGLVSAEDVRGFAADGKTVAAVPAATPAAAAEGQPGDISVPPLPDFSKWGEVERVPFRSIRRATASHHRSVAISVETATPDTPDCSERPRSCRSHD